MNRRRKMSILHCLLVVFIILGCFVVFQNINAKTTTTSKMTVSRYESVLVYEGDSVWSIAKDHLKNADEEQLTSYVEEIKEINNISQEGMIYAGRYLILPIYEKIEDRIVLLGARDDANKWYSAIDCLIMPSLFEGLPFTLVEAQASNI